MPSLTIRDSLELLKGLAAAGKLDSETKDYAQAAVEELSGKTGKARAQALDNDEPSELPRTLVVDHGMPIETGAEVEFADDQSSGQQDAKGFAQGIDLKPAPADATMSAPNPDVKITEEQARTGWYGLTGDSEETDDALGYESYARALAQVIADRNTKPPLTIGICAPWGRGKSVLMGLIRQEIEKLNLEIKESLTPLEHNCRTCKTLKFDAWRYSKAENVWAGFIDTVLRELQKGFKGRLRKLALAFKLNRGLDLPLLRQFGVFLAALVLILIAVVLAFPHDKSVSLPLLAGAAIAFCGKYLSGAWKLASSPITERVLQLSRLPDYQSRLDPIHKILDHIETVTQEYAKIPAKKSVERFVVFVDDIDRCKPEKIMETLEAIKHFLYLPQFVFVIAMDARVVRHAIGQHYDFMGDESHQKEEMGRFYLEKMLQIPFSLPPVGGEQLKDLNDVLLKEYVEDESESVIPGNSDSEPPSDKAPSDSPLKDDTNNSDESLDLAEGDADVRKKFGVDEEALRVLEEKNSESEIERLRIGKDEKRSIVGILETPGVAMSPRLFKRFINIYLIARYLHFERLKRLALDEKLPPVDLSKWLALSIIFPFESKALLQWWEENGWSNPLAEADGPFKPNGDFRLVEPDKKLSAPRKRPNTSAMFGGLDWPSLDEFGRALRALEIDPQTVKITRHITDCFNLVLD